MLRDSQVRRSLAAFAIVSALAIGVSALLVGAGLSDRNERDRHAALARHAQQQLRAYEGSSRLLYDPSSRGAAEKLVRADSELIGLRITVFSPEGALLADSAGGGPAGVERPEVAAAVASAQGITGGPTL